MPTLWRDLWRPFSQKETPQKRISFAVRQRSYSDSYREEFARNPSPQIIEIWQGSAFKSVKLPSFQFYPGDWLRDAISGCSLAAQGLWLRMMIIMHDCDRYGYLVQNGKSISAEVLARKCGTTLAELVTLLDELESAGIYSRSDEGIIFCRRMVRDQQGRAKNAERQKRHYDKEIKPNADLTVDLTPTSHASSSSSSSSKIKTTTCSPPGEPPPGEALSFEDFYSLYPKKQAKADALKAWDSCQKKKFLTKQVWEQTVRPALLVQRDSDKWHEDGGAYIPLPATWLRGRRWEDQMSLMDRRSPIREVIG